MTDQQTYDHYPENLRLNDEDTAIAKQMIAVGGKKQKIKMHLTEKREKPVLLKTLHNIQNNMQNEKNVGPENELHKLYNILNAIPDATVYFITDDDDNLLGRLPVILIFSFVTKLLL